MALHQGNGTDPNLSKEGLHFSAVAAVSQSDAVTALDGYFNQAHGKQSVSGYGFGEPVSYRVYEDMGGVTEMAGVTYIGLVRSAVHWLTTDKGLPLHFTTGVYQIIKRLNFEQNVPMHTPLMGVPRTARQVNSTEVAKLNPFTQSFRIEGELYASRFNTVEVVAGLLSAANGIAEYNAREAYGAILFGKSVSPMPPPVGNTEMELIGRAMDEATLVAVLHKRKDGFNYLASRAFTSMQSSPSKTSPNVAIMPFGKMASVMAHVNYSQQWTAGDIGSKRARYGVISDVGSGGIDDGDGKPLMLGGVEVKEAPFVRHFDTTAESLSRLIYTGDFYYFSPPSNAVFGGADALPWAKAYSTERDAKQDIRFEELFENSGMFKLVETVGKPEDFYVPPEDRLYRIDMDRYDGMSDADLPFDGSSADPFVFRNPGAGGVSALKLRGWCSMKKKGYMKDVKGFVELKPISDDEARMAAAESLGKEADPFAYTAKNATIKGWPVLKQLVEFKRTFNQKAEVINRKVAMGENPTPEEWKDVGLGAALKSADLEPYRFVESRKTDENAGGVEGRSMREWAEVLDFLMFAPYRESSMQDVAFIHSGPELGKTFMSSPNISIGHDAAQDSWLWSLRYRSVAVVINPDNVLVSRNAMCDGMGSGNNMEIQSPEDAMRLKDDGFVMEEGQASVVAIPIPKAKFRQNNLANYDPSRTVIATSGTIPLSGGRSMSTPHFPGYLRTGRMFGWDRVNISQMTGGTGLPVAPLMFKSDLSWPTQSGFVEEDSHCLFGKGGIGMREIRMTGRGLNPTAV